VPVPIPYHALQGAGVRHLQFIFHEDLKTQSRFAEFERQCWPCEAFISIHFGDAALVGIADSSVLLVPS